MRVERSRVDNVDPIKSTVAETTYGISTEILYHVSSGESMQRYVDRIVRNADVGRILDEAFFVAEESVLSAGQLEPILRRLENIIGIAVGKPAYRGIAFVCVGN